MRWLRFRTPMPRRQPLASIEYLPPVVTPTLQAAGVLANTIVRETTGRAA